jgi:hypothetical protein
MSFKRYDNLEWYRLQIKLMIQYKVHSLTIE